MTEEITNDFEYQGGVRDGEKITYRLSDLVIPTDSFLATGEMNKTNPATKIKREHTLLKSFSLDSLGEQD